MFVCTVYQTEVTYNDMARQRYLEDYAYDIL